MIARPDFERDRLDDGNIRRDRHSLGDPILIGIGKDGIFADFTLLQDNHIIERHLYEATLGDHTSGRVAVNDNLRAQAGVRRFDGVRHTCMRRAIREDVSRD